MQQVQIRINELKFCGFSNLDSSQICAGITDLIKDSCNGDSGGPLVSNENQSTGNGWTLSGIVSYGGESCDGKGVYTNVYFFLSWIFKKFSEN